MCYEIIEAVAHSPSCLGLQLELLLFVCSFSLFVPRNGLQLMK